MEFLIINKSTIVSITYSTIKPVLSVTIRKWRLSDTTAVLKKKILGK